MFRTIAVCSVFVPFVSQAAEDAVSRYGGMLPAQIMQLSEQERQSSVPMMLIGAASMATAPFGDILIRSNLNALMYDGMADYEGAKRAFQQDLGEESTGELTSWQVHLLNYRSSRLNMTSVSFFPFDFGGSIGEHTASVEGTLSIIDENIAYPINHVFISCRRSVGICDYRQIALTLPDENSWAQSYHVGEIADESYRITRWDGQMIDAVPVIEAECRTNQLSFNFQTQEFFEIARNNSEGDCDTVLGVSIPKLSKPRVSQISDGRDIVASEFQKIHSENFGFMSSDFRRQVSELTSEAGND